MTFRPSLLLLEDRVTPSTINVSTYSDAALRVAIATAITDSAGNNPVDIEFTAGPGTIELTDGVLDLNEGSGTGLVTINGANENIVVNAGGNSGVFQIESGSQVAIDRLTITGGTATNGGGINNAGALAVSNCTFFDNTATEGGAIYNVGDLTVNGSVFSQNAAQDSGGGIFNAGPNTVTATNCTFSGNSAQQNGGAICDSPGTLTVVDSTLSANSAQNGGGIYGGSTDVTTSVVTLTNSIVAGSGTQGGDLYSFNATFQGNNDIIDDGTGNASASGLSSTGYFADSYYDVSAGLSSSGLQDNGGSTQTIALAPGSPAIGAGAVLADVATDQRGASRPASAPDIGSYQTITFTSTASGDWQSPTTWSGGIPGHAYPVAGDFVVITNGNTVSIPVDETDAAAAVSIGDSSAAGTLQAAIGSTLNVGAITINASGYFGENGATIVVTGTWNQNGGQFVAGNVPSSVALYNLTLNGGAFNDSAPTSLTVTGLWLHNAGDFWPNGGTVTFDGATLRDVQVTRFAGVTIVGIVDMTHSRLNTFGGGPLTIESGATLNSGNIDTQDDLINNGTLNFVGGFMFFQASNWINNGVFNGTNSQVIFTRPGPIACVIGGTSVTTFASLTIRVPTTLAQSTIASSLGFGSGATLRIPAGYTLTDGSGTNTTVLAVSQNPEDAVVATPGAGASFTIATTGSDASVQWQVSTDGGSTWSNASGGTYSGDTTDTLTIASSTGLLGDQYRVLFTDAPWNSNVISTTATLFEAPSITSSASASFTIGTTSSFFVTAVGYPTPQLSYTGNLPAGVTFDTSTGAISGAAGALTAGVYTIVITAGNGHGTDASQSFTLTVNQPASWFACPCNGQASEAVLSGNTLSVWTGTNWSVLTTNASQVIGAHDANTSTFVVLQGSQLSGWNGSALVDCPVAVSSWVAFTYNGQPSVAVLSNTGAVLIWTGSAWTQVASNVSRLIGIQSYQSGASFVTQSGTQLSGWNGTTLVSCPSAATSWAAFSDNGQPSVAVLSSSGAVFIWSGTVWTQVASNIAQLIGSQSYQAGAWFIIQSGNQLSGWNGVALVPCPSAASSWVTSLYSGRPSVTVLATTGSRALMWTGTAWSTLPGVANQLIGTQTGSATFVLLHDGNQPSGWDGSSLVACPITSISWVAYNYFGRPSVASLGGGALYAWTGTVWNRLASGVNQIIGTQSFQSNITFVTRSGTTFTGFAGGDTSVTCPAATSSWVAYTYNGQPSVASLSSSGTLYTWTGSAWHATGNVSQIIGSQTNRPDANFVMVQSGNRLTGMVGGTNTVPGPVSVSSWVAYNYLGQPSVAALAKPGGTLYAWTGGSWTILTGSATQIIGSQTYQPGISFVMVQNNNLFTGMVGGITSVTCPATISSWVAYNYNGQPSVAALAKPGGTLYAWTGGSWTILTTSATQIVGSQTYQPGITFVMLQNNILFTGMIGGISSVSCPARTSSWVAYNYSGQPSVASLSKPGGTLYSWTGGSWTILTTSADQLIGSQAYQPNSNFVMVQNGNILTAMVGGVTSKACSAPAISWVACDYFGQPSVAAIVPDQYQVTSTTIWAGGGWLGFSDGNSGGDRLIGSHTYVPGANFVEAFHARLAGWDGITFKDTPYALSDWVACDYHNQASAAALVAGATGPYVWTGTAWQHEATGATGRDALIGSQTYTAGANFVVITGTHAAGWNGSTLDNYPEASAASFAKFTYNGAPAVAVLSTAGGLYAWLGTTWKTLGAGVTSLVATNYGGQASIVALDSGKMLGWNGSTLVGWSGKPWSQTTGSPTSSVQFRWNGWNSVAQTVNGNVYAWTGSAWDYLAGNCGSLTATNYGGIASFVTMQGTHLLGWNVNTFAEESATTSSSVATQWNGWNTVAQSAGGSVYFWTGNAWQKTVACLGNLVATNYGGRPSFVFFGPDFRALGWDGTNFQEEKAPGGMVIIQWNHWKTVAQSVNGNVYFWTGRVWSLQSSNDQPLLGTTTAGTFTTVHTVNGKQSTLLWNGSDFVTLPGTPGQYEGSVPMSGGNTAILLGGTLSILTKGKTIPLLQDVHGKSNGNTIGSTFSVQIGTWLTANVQVNCNTAGTFSVAFTGIQLLTGQLVSALVEPLTTQVNRITAALSPLTQVIAPFSGHPITTADVLEVALNLNGDGTAANVVSQLVSLLGKIDGVATALDSIPGTISLGSFTATVSTTAALPLTFSGAPSLNFSLLSGLNSALEAHYISVPILSDASALLQLIEGNPKDITLATFSPPAYNFPTLPPFTVNVATIPTPVGVITIQGNVEADFNVLLSGSLSVNALGQFTSNSNLTLSMDVSVGLEIEAALGAPDFTVGGYAVSGGWDFHTGVSVGPNGLTVTPPSTTSSITPPHFVGPNFNPLQFAKDLGNGLENGNQGAILVVVFPVVAVVDPGIVNVKHLF